MKTAMIARCMFASAAIFAAAGLIGCGAEQGSGEPGAIGESSQALGGSNPTSAAGNSLAQTRQEPGSCAIDDRGTVKMLVAGGFDSLGTTAYPDIEVYTPGGTFTRAKDSGGANVDLTQARGLLKGIPVPGDVHSCLFIGGQSKLVAGTGVTTYATVEKVTVDVNGKFSITPETSLLTPRANFDVQVCNDKVMAISGTRVVSNLESWVNDIEVASASVPTAAWTSRATLAVGVKDFGLAKDPYAAAASARYVLAGGRASGGETDAIQIITTATNTGVTCGTVTVTQAKDNAHHANLLPLAQAIQGNKVFPDGTSSSTPDTFVRAGGYSATSSPALVLGTETIHVDDWANAYITLGTGISLTKGSFRASFGGPIANGANNNAFILAGGSTTPVPGTNSSIAVTDAVQEYQTGQSLMKVSLSSQRARATAETIGGVLYIAGGGSVASGTVTLNAATEIVTP